ncbi:MAG: hypothetical protein ACI4V7_11300 [Succinivibrionaceae bacterium]
MNNDIYENVVEQLNNRTQELLNQAEYAIANFLNIVKELSGGEFMCNVIPVISHTNGLPSISWFNKDNQDIFPCDITTNSVDFSSVRLQPVVEQYVNKTEIILSEIRKELNFVFSVFKKLNYWNKFYTKDEILEIDAYSESK